MSRFRHTDILVELIDLCQERTIEVRQLLAYYRASVYKGEMAVQINDKIEQLRLLAGLFGDVLLCESFKDYEEMAKDGAVPTVPGECSFSRRVAMLSGALDGHLDRLGRQLASRSLLPTSEAELADSVRKHRTALLALCRHGSRPWTFFQSLA
jgi:hypothetical protein